MCPSIVGGRSLNFFQSKTLSGVCKGEVLGILARGCRNFRYFWEVGEVLDIVFEVGVSRYFYDVGIVCEVTEIFDVGVKWMRF